MSDVSLETFWVIQAVSGTITKRDATYDTTLMVLTIQYIFGGFRRQNRNVFGGFRRSYAYKYVLTQ